MPTIASFQPSSFDHMQYAKTARHQKLDSGKAWEWGYAYYPLQLYIVTKFIQATTFLLGKCAHCQCSIKELIIYCTACGWAKNFLWLQHLILSSRKHHVAAKLSSLSSKKNKSVVKENWDWKCETYKRVRCYLLSKSLLPQKPEKWAKMMSQEDNLVLLSEFLEKGECRVLVVYANQQGQLMPSTSFPNTTKTKVVCVRVLES